MSAWQGLITATTHNHCTHCDGRATARQMADAAVELGFEGLGFSCHSDPLCAHLDEEAYIRDIRALQQEYAGKLRISLGVEQDLFQPVRQREAFDYVLGSVHYVRGPESGKLYPMDWDVGAMYAAAREFGGMEAVVRAYYAGVEENVRRFRPDVVGHLDLVVKNNAGGRLFDEDSPWYREAALRALEACVCAGCVVELNTGGVYRGYRDAFYPAPFLLRELARLGGRVTVNADAHEPAALAFGFDEALEQLKNTGFSSVFVWEGTKFAEKPLC